MGKKRQDPRVIRRPLKRSGNTPGGLDDGQWWRHTDPGPSLWDTVHILDRQQTPARVRDQIYVAMYENRMPFATGNMAQTPRPALGLTTFGGLRVTLNVVKSVVDTVESLIAKNKAEIRIVTSGGSWKQQREARQLTKFLSGMFYASDIYAHSQKVFKDGCKTRAGWLMVWKDKEAGKIRCERVLPETVTWNEMEGEHPRSLYRRVGVARETLLADYPEKRKAIEDAPKASNAVNPVKGSRRTGLALYADLVEVVEGWHLPAGKTVPGRHVIAIKSDAKTEPLFEEEWTYEFFPLIPFTWDDAHDGLGGIPLAETISGYQVALNRKLRTILRGQELACVPRVWKEMTTAEVPDEQTTNEPGSIGYYAGAPPTIAPGAAFGPEVYNFLDWMYRKCFEEAGVSMLQSQGTKPAGVESGEALREFNDITTTRHVVKGQRFERFFEAVAKVMLAFAKDMYAEGHKIRVLAPGTKFLEEIDWKDVDMEEDQYIMRSFAVSFLPTHPVGRLEFVKDMLKAGLLPQEYAVSLLGFPDLEKVTTLEAAALELSMMMCERALYDGEYIQPEPFQNLDLLKRMAQKYYLESLMMKDVPEKNRDYLRRLMTEADERIKAMQPAPAPAPMPAGPVAPEMPPGMPMPSPAVPSMVPA